MMPLPRVELLCKLLARQASTVFSQIAEAEKRNVLFGKAQSIGSTNGPIDMKISKMEKSRYQTRIAFIPTGLSNTIQVTQIVFLIESGISAIQSKESSAIQLGEGRVKDLKWDESVLLVLWELNGETNILCIPANSPNDAIFSNDEVLRQFAIGMDRTSFVPGKLAIRKGRLVVLGEDRLHYKILKPAETRADEDVLMV